MQETDGFVFREVLIGSYEQRKTKGQIENWREFKSTTSGVEAYQSVYLFDGDMHEQQEGGYGNTDSKVGGSQNAQLLTETKGAVMSDEGKVVATIERGAKKQLRVTLSEFKEKTYIHIREYVKIDDFWSATKKGVCLYIEDAPLLFTAMRKLDDELKRTGDI